MCLPWWQDHQNSVEEMSQYGRNCFENNQCDDVLVVYLTHFLRAGLLHDILLEPGEDGLLGVQCVPSV
jgi:hypothetical protein